MMNLRHARQTHPRYCRRDAMSPNRARRARRATIGVTVLLVAVLVLAACRLAGVLIFDWLGNGAFNSQQYAQAEQYYGANMKLNVIEPWIASYDRGTSRAAESNYADAKKDLRAALDMAPQEQKCRVGMNLVWTLEESVTMQNLNRGTAQADTLKEAKAIAQRLKCHGKHCAPVTRSADLSRSEDRAVHHHETSRPGSGGAARLTVPGKQATEGEGFRAATAERSVHKESAGP